MPDFPPAPPSLFKYQSGSLDSVAGLAAGKLWIASPKTFNDPFDCAIMVTVPRPTLAEAESILQSMPEQEAIAKHRGSVTIEQLLDTISNAAESAARKAAQTMEGVCCFSEVVDSLLMWGHYSDSHKGFCLEFDTSPDLGQEMFLYAKPVRYSDSFPTLDWHAMASGDMRQWMELFLTKATCWSYERECGTFHDKGNFPYGYQRQSLRRLYFGARMSESRQMMIASLLANTDTQFSRMVLAKDGFRLHSEPVTFTAIDYRTKPAC